MKNIFITVKGVVIRPTCKLLSDYVLFTIYVENGRPQDQIKTMCKVRLYETRPGDFVAEETHSGGYTDGVLAMLDIITKENWGAKLIELSWKMQKENQDEIEEHYEA